MKNIMKNAALALTLALTVGAPAALAKHKKASAEHVAAIKKCNDDYAAAKKDAMGKKGKDRAAANAKAKADKKQCIASAPK